MKGAGKCPAGGKCPVPAAPYRYNAFRPSGAPQTAGRAARTFVTPNQPHYDLRDRHYGHVCHCANPTKKPRRRLIIEASSQALGRHLASNNDISRLKTS